MLRTFPAEPYVPERGDIIWLDWMEVDELPVPIQGRYPGLVLSARSFQECTGSVVVVPILSTNHEYAFGVPLPEYLYTVGVVPEWVPRILDYRHRRAEFIERGGACLCDDMCGVS